MRANSGAAKRMKKQEGKVAYNVDSVGVTAGRAMNAVTSVEESCSANVLVVV